MRLKVIFYAVILAILFSGLTFSNDEQPILWDDLPSALKYADQSSQVCVVIFGADWCPYCIKMKNKLLKNHKLLDKIIICYIDTDEYPELAKSYNAKTLPKTIYYKNGIKSKTIIGYHDIEVVLKDIANVL